MSEAGRDDEEESWMIGIHLGPAQTESRVPKAGRFLSRFDGCAAG